MWRSSSLTLRAAAVRSHASRWEPSHQNCHLRRKVWSSPHSCWAKTLDTTCANMISLSRKYSSSSSSSSKSSEALISSLSRSSFGTRVQWSFHLLDKMLVATDSLVGRKERMWQRRDSGRSLILSTTAIFFFFIFGTACLPFSNFDSLILPVKVSKVENMISVKLKELNRSSPCDVRKRY